MTFIAIPVKIPEAIQPVLFKFAKSKAFPTRQVQRAKIILLATNGLDNMQISKQIGLGQDSVSKQRNRFVKNIPLLQEIAQKELSQPEDSVSSFLNDAPRPGQPPRYSDSRSSICLITWFHYCTRTYATLTACTLSFTTSTSSLAWAPSRLYGRRISHC